MRIPTNKIYRAFDELDVFSDTQCELLLRRIELGKPSRTTIAGVGWLVGIVVAIFATGAMAGVSFEPYKIWPGQFSREQSDYLQLFVGMFICFGSAASTGLLTRDWLLRRELIKAITLRIDRVRCRQCRYILIGQQPYDGVVTCPECGARNPLVDLGVQADDLIPPQTPEEQMMLPDA